MVIYYVININGKVCPKNQSRAGATGGGQIMLGLWAHRENFGFCSRQQGAKVEAGRSVRRPREDPGLTWRSSIGALYRKILPDM